MHLQMLPTEMGNTVLFRFSFIQSKYWTLNLNLKENVSKDWTNCNISALHPLEGLTQEFFLFSINWIQFVFAMFFWREKSICTMQKKFKRQKKMFSSIFFSFAYSGFFCRKLFNNLTRLNNNYQFVILGCRDLLDKTLTTEVSGYITCELYVTSPFANNEFFWWK